MNCQVDLRVTARKLKKDWVEKKKIKSIWRRQKQKQGLLAVKAESTQQEEATISNPDWEPEETESNSEGSHRVDVDRPASSATTSFVPPQLSAPKAQTKLTLPVPQLDKSHQVPEERSLATHRGRSRAFLRGQAGQRGSGSLRGKGKQPDMRVKMGRLLEKIKQNHSKGQNLG